MTADLSALPQHVREAAELFDIDAEKGTRYTRHDDWQTIRAELLRLAGENAELHAFRDTLMCTEQAASERAERAESELAALRKRIAEAPVGTYEAGLADHGIVNTHRWASRAMIGKRVAMLTVTDEDKA